MALDLMRFSPRYIAELLQQRVAVDGTQGGLLLGRPHDEGGIPLLMQQPDGYYKVCREIEGMEYVLNITQNPELASRLEILNNLRDRQEVAIGSAIPKHITTIDCCAASDRYYTYDTPLLVLDRKCSYYVINKHSTWKHLELLDRFNKGNIIKL